MIGSLLKRFDTFLGGPSAVLRVGEPFFRWIGRRPANIPRELRNVHNVLVIRLDEIGDVTLTTPFLRELRKNLPSAFITLLVKPPLAALMKLCPYVNEVLVFDWDFESRFPLLRRHARALRLAWRRLWLRRFDLAIVPRWDHDSYHASFLAYFSGAPWRVGYSETVAHWKESMQTGYDPLFTQLSMDRKIKHEVLHNLDLLRFIGGLVEEDRCELWIDAEAKQSASDYMASLKKNTAIIAFGVDSRIASKCWPMEHYQDLARRLVKAGYAVMLAGGPTSVAGDAMQWGLEQDRILDVRGKTSLVQLAALFERCALYLGNDTGPKHMAAALGIPVLEISSYPPKMDVAWGGPERFYPWGVPYRMIHPPVVDQIASIAPAVIFAAALEMLKT